MTLDFAAAFETWRRPLRAFVREAIGLLCSDASFSPQCVARCHATHPNRQIPEGNPR
jgi:hypothetical protein